MYKSMENQKENQACEEACRGWVSEDQGPLLGVIRIVVYWGLHSGLPVYGAPHFESRSSN